MENTKPIIITIDGPAGSGKSTIAKQLAKHFGFYYLATGMLYRAVAYVLATKINKLPFPFNADQAATVTPADLACINDLDYQWTDNNAIITYQGTDITREIRSEQAGQAASIISTIPVIRQALDTWQRQLADAHNLIAEGRDCGTVVFPHATLKFFLTVSVDARAKWLLADQSRAQVQRTLEHIKQEIIERDERDKKRVIAPLVIPDGAIIIDSSNMKLQAAVDMFTHIIADAIDSLKK